MTASTTLAVALHDPGGRMLTGIERLDGVMRGLFSGIAVSATTTTDAAVIDALIGTTGAVATHEAEEGTIGDARREAVALALALSGDQILYSDADHILRWVAARPDEVERALIGQPADLLVIGRSLPAFDASPQRLRDTEVVVNHIYGLMHPGRDWDLMFATRRLSRRAAEVIVDHCREPTLANDVVWPLLVERHGLTVDYFAADGLSYLTIDDFGRAADEHDHDPLEWIRRLEFAAGHASAMRPFLPAPRR